MNWNKASKGFTISGLAKLSKQKARHERQESRAWPELLLLGQSKSRGEEGTLKNVKYTDRPGTSSSFREIEERNALEAIEELGRAVQLNQELKQPSWVIPQLSIPMVDEEIS